MNLFLSHGTGMINPFRIIGLMCGIFETGFSIK